MYFVICVFMALCALALDVLFTEMFPLWFKAVLAVLGSASAGYAVARGLRFVASKTKWFAKPPLTMTFVIAAIVTFVIVMIVTIILKKRKKKKSDLVKEEKATA